MGVFCSGVSKPLWLGGGGDTLGPASSTNAALEQPLDKRNGVGGSLRSHPPQLVSYPCPFLWSTSHRQSSSAHIHVVSSQGQRAAALLGCRVLSTMSSPPAVDCPPATCPSIFQLKKLNLVRPEIQLLVASETMFFLVCQNCLFLSKIHKKPPKMTCLGVMQEEFRQRGASQFLPKAGLASDTLD